MAKVKNNDENLIIVSWIGATDINAMNSWRANEGLTISCSLGKAPLPYKGDCGPIRTFTDTIPAKKIYLLSTKAFESSRDDITSWVTDNAKSKDAVVEVIMTGVENPISYDEVFSALTDFFKKHWKKPQAHLYKYLLTPGTPVTHAVLLYMSQVVYPGGKAYQTAKPEHAGDNPNIEVKLPFKLGPNIVKDDNVSLADPATFDTIKRIYAPNRDVNILLLGDSGTGKSVSAHDLHNSSGAKGKFVVANCAELADGDANMFRSSLFGHVKGAFSGATENRKGLFEEASDGTIFIDEIAEIPLPQQTILLRALQEKKCYRVGDTSKSIDISNVRVIAATNHDLLKDVREHKFREDLYYRIAVCTYKLQSLSEILKSNASRFDEIVEEILEKYTKNGASLENCSFSITDAAWMVMKNFSWPGNVRQLEHVLLLSCVYAKSENNCVINDEIVKMHLIDLSRAKKESESKDIDSETDVLPEHPWKWVEDKKAQYVEIAMKENNQQISKAARRLGCTYQKLEYYLKNNRNLKK